MFLSVAKMKQKKKKKIIQMTKEKQKTTKQWPVN